MKERFFYGFKINKSYNGVYGFYKQNIQVDTIIDFIRVSKKLKEHLIPFRIEVCYWDDFLDQFDTISYNGPEDILDVVMTWVDARFEKIIIMPLTFGVSHLGKAPIISYPYIERMVDSSFLRKDFLGLGEKFPLRDYLKYKKGELRRKRKSRALS